MYESRYTSALAKLVTREAETDRLRAGLAARATTLRFASALTYDPRMAQAAAALGLPVERP